MRGSITAIFWPPNLWPSALSLSRSSDAKPEVLGSTMLGAVFTHLISIFSGPQLIRAQMAPRPDVAFPSTARLQLSATPLSRRTQLSYIIVRRPLDLWNRMFNRHQAEITVMQFTGHSLPVHQSMSVPWEFFSSSHFISQFPPTRFPLITAIRMYHFLPVHHLEWHFGPGQKVKI